MSAAARRALLCGLIAACGACGDEGGRPGTGAAPPPSIIVQDRFEVTRSRHDHAATRARLFEALDRRELAVFAVVDHAAAAAGIGAALPPSVLVVFGDPEAGTPLIEEVPLMGIELPMKALVFVRGEETYLALTSPESWRRAYPLDDAAVLGRMAALTESLAAEVAGP